MFQRAHSCGSDGHDPALLCQRCVDLLRRLGSDAVALAMHLVLLHLLHAHWLEGSEADIKSDLRNLHTALANLLQYLRREMQTSGGGSDRAAGVVARKDCLVALAVLGAVRPRDVRRQGHVT